MTLKEGQNVQHLRESSRQKVRGRRGGESFFIGHSISSADTSITHVEIDAINLPPLVVRQNLKRFPDLHKIRTFPVQNIRRKDRV
jgi:hypothetical protein